MWATKIVLWPPNKGLGGLWGQHLNILASIPDGAGSSPCQQLSHKPPECQRRALWPWRVRERPDKGHGPSPSPPLGEQEKPGQTKQIKVTADCQNSISIQLTHF